MLLHVELERTTSVRLGPTPSVRSVSYTDGRTKFSKTDGYAAAHYEEILISHGGPGGGSIGGPARLRPDSTGRRQEGGRAGRLCSPQYIEQSQSLSFVR